MNSSITKTTFDTMPVQSLFEAIKSFACAFDLLQKNLDMSESNSSFLDRLKDALYKPVYPNNESAPICLFEIGIMYVPSATGSGVYDVNPEKLKKALSERESDVRALFINDDGLLADLTGLLQMYIDTHPDIDLSHAAHSLHNECLRLWAMF